MGNAVSGWSGHGEEDMSEPLAVTSSNARLEPAEVRLACWHSVSSAGQSQSREADPFRAQRRLHGEWLLRLGQPGAKSAASAMFDASFLSPVKPALLSPLPQMSTQGVSSCAPILALRVEHALEVGNADGVNTGSIDWRGTEMRAGEMAIKMTCWHKLTQARRTCDPIINLRHTRAAQCTGENPEDGSKGPLQTRQATWQSSPGALPPSRRTGASLAAREVR